MNQSHFIGALCAFATSSIILSANAELQGRLPATPGDTDYQAAYDTNLDITWVTNAALAPLGTWEDQVVWANNLNYLGYDDWRLASMSVATGLPTSLTEEVVDCSTIWQPLCADNELGYMFFHNLGGNQGQDLTGNRVLGDVTLFDIQPFYWSASESGITNAWMYHFDIGFGVWSPKNGLRHAWAVRDGDVSSAPVNASPLSGQGSWETSLQPRDLDGDSSTVEAYYDVALDVTWLRDANFALSNPFGLMLSDNQFDVNPNTVGSTGRMTWFNAMSWIAGMNSAGYGGNNQWRLPSTSPMNFFTSINPDNYSYNGTWDRGYNVGAPGTGYDGNTNSEMAYMSYHTLGNLGYCSPQSSSVTACSPLQSGWGITNTGPFYNINTSSYWSASEFSADTEKSWLFNFRFGDQDGVNKSVTRYAWAVHPGDIGIVLVDTDGDLVVDGADNCIQVSNTNQHDADADGHGNICDADFNNDCNVNAGDLALFKAGYLSTNPVLDLNSDGVVNASDLGLFKSLYFGVPGPSAPAPLCTP